MTRVQFRDLLRSLSSELDNKAVMDAEINEWIDWGQGRVANDILASGIGIKNLIKQATPTFTVQEITGYETASNITTFTVTAHGYEVGDIVIVQDMAHATNDVTALDGIYEIIAKDTNTFNVNAVHEDTGSSQTPLAGWVTNGYCDAESDIMDIAKPIVDIQVKFTSITGTAGNEVDYKKATEKLPAQFEDMNPYSSHNVSYSTATEGEPVYCIDGSPTGTKIIRVYPANVDFAILKYYMRPAAISSDSTTISIPDEFRDLLLLEVKSKMDFKLHGFERSQITAVNYQKKMQELFMAYQNRTGILKQAREDLTKD